MQHMQSRSLPGNPRAIQSQERQVVTCLDDRRGTSALEFTIIAPLLLLILFGVIKSAVTFNNYIELNNAAGAAMRVLAASRGSATPATNATNAVNLALPNLTQASLTIALYVPAGTKCTTDTACASALTTNIGGSTSVSLTYPCDMNFMGVNFIPGCTLTSSTTGRIE